MSQFQDDIVKFNGIYKLPVESTPTLKAVGDPVARLTAFKNILSEELDEIDAIISKLQTIDQSDSAQSLDTLTDLTDLLGDIQVYCASEMAKFGLPLDKTLGIIMQSNFSKLGADGNPIYDERGKVQKGPNYWKPEPALREMLAKASQVVPSVPEVELMSIYSPAGTKVQFINKNGYETDRAYALKQGLKEGEIYTVSYTEVGSSWSIVKLDGIEGTFNTVCFAAVQD